MSVREKRSIISPDQGLTIQRQCDLLGLHRSSYYYAEKEDESYTEIMNEIMDIWREHPFFGYRRITCWLLDRGIRINHKCALRLMKLMGLRSILPKPRTNTSIANRENAVRPYLLKELVIDHKNQVWATDITYIKLPGGMVYLFALIDWHTRFVVGWKLANTMEASHGIEVLEEAIKRHGSPEIVNSDQGSQFTGEAWILAAEAHGIKVSHDGVGRCIDNIRIERLWWSIKYEHIHLYCHQTMWELEKGLEHYLIFYNTKRRHQGIKNKRPADLYLVGEIKEAA
ncbi:IS3 family transposase [Candidatus Finniella inopinata]|uniref:IS3 family transposase n=1 Tax=Candidatus Finniella inopinata TaxID=1696036 RepID=A0A4Q7DGS2_9PROT|nr:IS3 family transposase [Candidatus Finniella inopinata]RZI46091.1 IS3 family transposase [Candidatus Finniella inopinata]